MHYVVANLVSLFAMTVLRYLLADKWIWNKKNEQRHNRQLEEEESNMPEHKDREF